MTCITSIVQICSHFDINQRGNKKTLLKHRARLDARKHSFSNRVVDLWNSLLDSVISAEIVFSFEMRSDNYWKDQDILYEYESKIHFKLQGNLQDEELELQLYTCCKPFTGSKSM